MAVTDTASLTLDLKKLEVEEIVQILVDGGPEYETKSGTKTVTVVAGRLLLVPNGEERDRKLQLGIIEPDRIRWMVGSELLKLGPVPRTGSYYTVIASSEVTTTQPLLGHLFDRPLDQTHIIGTVTGFRSFSL
jgi:hypothetical protein